MENLTLQEKLLKVQTELKAPKNQYNAFGKYKYRNQEDILEAVKPLLAKYHLNIAISDEAIEVAGQPFCNSKVIVWDTDNNQPSLQVHAQAAIDFEKKGMSKDQASGSASSYARKYALNGLFLIDDTKDADSTNTHGKDQKPQGKTVLPKSGEKFNKAKEFIKNGGSIDSIKAKYQVSKQVEQLLLN